ncbi:MAG: carbohydrate ABC transporter permease [Ruminococcaceae bacterium]|nr:carbohydrate ABC transporter permease [Oscillospiraceae bacterium]
MKKLKLPDLKVKSTYQLKRKGVSAVVSVMRYAFLIAIGYVVLIQLIYMCSYAFRITDEVNDASVVWVPKTYTLENFKVALEALQYFKVLINTLGVQVLGGLIEVFTCSVAAYGFARYNFRGKKFFFAIVILMILVPPQMTAVSMSLNYAYFDLFGILEFIGNLIGKEIRPNLLNSGMVFWMPSLFGVGLRSGLFIFIYNQFFKGLPKELEEAAYIDGANAFTTFIRVVLPSSGVAFLTVTIFSVVWHWNDYYLSILYLNDNQPLSVSLSKLASSIYNMSGYGSNSISYSMAACILYILPVIVMYLLLQRKFIASIDRVGIVG